MTFISLPTRLMQRGYDDRKHNRPFMAGAEFDSLSSVLQRHYEQGRLLAVNIMAAGLPLPEWAEEEHMPAEIDYAHDDANRKVGSPLGAGPSHIADKEHEAPFSLDQWRHDVLQSVT
jgi:hypothetical protein